MSCETTGRAPVTRIPELGAIRRILAGTGVLAIIAAVGAWAHLGAGWAAGLAGGALLGCLNLVFLTALFVEILRPAGRRRGTIAALLAIKVPLVYGGLAALLLWRAIPVLAVVLGFSLVLLVIVLRAAGRALLDSGLLPAPDRAGRRG